MPTIEELGLSEGDIAKTGRENWIVKPGGPKFVGVEPGKGPYIEIGKTNNCRTSVEVIYLSPDFVNGFWIGQERRIQLAYPGFIKVYPAPKD